MVSSYRLQEDRFNLCIILVHVQMLPRHRYHGGSTWWTKAAQVKVTGKQRTRMVPERSPVHITHCPQATPPWLTQTQQGAGNLCWVSSNPVKLTIRIHGHRNATKLQRIINDFCAFWVLMDSVMPFLLPISHEKTQLLKQLTELMWPKTLWRSLSCCLQILRFCFGYLQRFLCLNIALSLENSRNIVNQF